ncbi:MAG: hypothetical protein ABR540_20535 [Acidimicrobiales bacterium]
MFKRLFWLSVGMTLGLGGSFWVQRRLRQSIERFLPDRVAQQATESVRRLRDDLRAAALEGQAAMQEREVSLRAQLRPPAV